MKKGLCAAALLFVLLFAGRLCGAPTVERLTKALPRFEGWKMETPFSMPEDGFVTVGADYYQGDRFFQFMVIAGPEAPSAGPCRKSWSRTGRRAGPKRRRRCFPS
jgi:hypothetical protein